MDGYQTMDRHLQACKTSRNYCKMSNSYQSTSNVCTEVFQNLIVWRVAQVVLPVLLYGMLVFICNFLEELTPIFASASAEQGGLGLSFAQLAWPLSVASGLLIPCTLYAYPLLQVSSFFPAGDY